MSAIRLFMRFSALSLCGCNGEGGWYDFGNGLVNLNNTHLISSAASLSMKAEPKMQIDETSTEEQIVRYQAHEQYCNDTLIHRNLEGSIPEIDKQSKPLFDAIVKASTTDFLKTCRVRLAGEGSIKFDDFTLGLGSYKVELDGRAAMTPEQTKEYLVGQLGVLAEGASPWRGDYEEVLKQAKPAWKIW